MQSKNDAAFWFNDYLDDVCRDMLKLKVHRDVVGPARFSHEQSEILKFAKRMRKQGTEVAAFSQYVLTLTFFHNSF